jgi:hypothetical protein
MAINKHLWRASSFQIPWFVVLATLGYVSLFGIHFVDPNHQRWPDIPTVGWIPILIGILPVLRAPSSPKLGLITGAFVFFGSGIYCGVHLTTWHDTSLILPILMAALGAITIALANKIWLDRWLRAFTKHTREATAVGVAVCVFGMLLALFAYFHTDSRPDKFEQAVIVGLTFFLTILLLVLAVYSIRGYLDRPLEIPDILDALADVINGINAESGASETNGFLLFICEYVAIGALTQLKDILSCEAVHENVLRKHYHPDLPDLFTDFQHTKSNWRVIMICPARTKSEAAAENSAENPAGKIPPLSMEEHIEVYAERNRLRGAVKCAIKLNEAFVRIFESLPDGRGKRWPPKVEIPKYQAVVLGTYGSKDERVVAKEGLVFFALDSPPVSPKLDPTKNNAEPIEPKPPGDENNSQDAMRREVAILAWHLTDRKSLRSLMGEARRLSGVTTDQELLNIS